MTYLFVRIALPVMNAVLAPTGAIGPLLLPNGAMVAVMYALSGAGASASRTAAA